MKGKIAIVLGLALLLVVGLFVFAQPLAAAQMSPPSITEGLPVTGLAGPAWTATNQFAALSMTGATVTPSVTVTQPAAVNTEVLTGRGGSPSNLPVSELAAAGFVLGMVFKKVSRPRGHSRKRQHKTASDFTIPAGHTELAGTTVPGRGIAT